MASANSQPHPPMDSLSKGGGAAFRGRGIEESNASTPTVNSNSKTLSPSLTASPPATSRKQQLLTPKSNILAGAGPRSSRANNGERTPSTTLTPRGLLGVPSSASSSRSPSKPLALSPFAQDLTKKGRPVPKREWNDSTAVPKPIDTSLGKGRLSNAEGGGGEALATEVGKLLDGLSPSPPHAVGSTQISPKPLTAPGGGSSASPRRLQKLLPKGGEKHEEGDGLSGPKIPRPPPSTLASTLSLAEFSNNNGNTAFSSTFSATVSPRSGGSVAKRYETDRFAKSLSERAAANEALKLLVNRMFKGGFEEQERRRLKIEMKEQDGFAEILDSFAEEYKKAQKREQQNSYKRAILAIKESVGKEETKARRQASDEELSARQSLEQAARQSARMINKMGKFSQQQEAERDRFVSEEARRRINYEDDETEKAAILTNKHKLLMAKVREDVGKYEERLAMETELQRRQWAEQCEQQCLELGDDERTQRGVAEVEEAEKRKEIKSLAHKESQTLQTFQKIREGLRQVEVQESNVRENGWGGAVGSSNGNANTSTSTNVTLSMDSRSVAKTEEEAFALIVRKAAEALVAVQQSAIDRKANQKKAREALEADEEVRRELIVDEASVTFENDIEKAAEHSKISILGAAAEAEQRLSEERRTIERDEESTRKTILQESHQHFERNILVAVEAEKKALEDSRRSKLAAISEELHDLVALSVTTSDSLFEEASRIFKSTIADAFIAEKSAIEKAHAARVEIEDDEEGARALILADEERLFENGLVAGRDQSYKLANDARLRREEEERRNESNLTAQLEAAADTALQQAMLNNKRQERTRQLKQQEQGEGADSGNGGSGDNPSETVPKSKFELLLDSWIKPLVNLYLKLDDLVSKGEPADGAMSEYNSMKIKFAMQLAQFKRANPVKASVAKNAANATTNLGASLRHTNNATALEMTLGGSKKGELSPLSQAELDDLHRRIRATRLVRPFFELLVRDTDANRPNVTLMSTLLTDNLPVDFAAIIREDNLLADAAVDGSVSYFDTFLGVPGLNVEPARSAELMTMALTNPKKRIQFSETILRREHALGTMALKNEMAPIWQRFLIQVGGSLDLPADIAGLDRRPTVLSQMFNRSHSVLVDVSAPATEKVCPVTRDTVMTRLAILGDLDTFQVLLKSADTQQFGDALITPRPTDGLTPLMLAIENNRVGFVQMLLQFPHVRKTIRYQEAHEGSSGRGTAYEIASNSTSCDDAIVEMVLGCGDGDAAPSLSDALAMSISSNAHVREIQQRFASFSPSATATMGMTVASSTGAGALMASSSSPKAAAAAGTSSHASRKAAGSLGIGSLNRLGGFDDDDDDDYFGGDDDATLTSPTLSPLKHKHNNTNTSGVTSTTPKPSASPPQGMAQRAASETQHNDTFGDSLDGLDDPSSGSLMGDDMGDSPQKSFPATTVGNTKQQQQPVATATTVATTAAGNSAFYGGGESDAIGDGWDDDEIDLEGGFGDSEDEL